MNQPHWSDDDEVIPPVSRNRRLLKLGCLFGLIMAVLTSPVSYPWFRGYVRQRAIQQLQKVAVVDLEDPPIGKSDPRIHRPVRVRLQADCAALPWGLDLSQVTSFSFGGWKVSESVLKRFAASDKLTHLDIDQAANPDECLACFADCQRLDTLSVSSPAFSGESLGALQLSHLTSLFLDGSGITDVNMKYVGQCKTLISLRLSRTKITDAGLMHLQDLRQLKSLDIEEVEFTGVGLEKLNAEELSYVEASKSKLTDSGLRFLESSPKMSYLSLSDTSIRGAGLKALANSTLETLVLDNSAFDDEGAEAISTLSHLKTLSLEKTKITDVGLRHLSQLKVLETLTLNQTSVTSSGFREFGEMPALRSLKLSQTKFDGVDVKLSCPLLEDVQLADTLVTDQGLAFLSNSKDLGTVFLCGTPVTGTGFAALKDCKISDIYLCHGGATNEGMQAISQLGELVFIDLSETKVNAEGVKSLSASKSLNHINFSSTGASSEDGGENVEVEEKTAPEDNAPGDAIVDVVINWPSEVMPYLHLPEGQISNAAAARLESERLRRQENPRVEDVEAMTEEPVPQPEELIQPSNP